MNSRQTGIGRLVDALFASLIVLSFTLLQTHTLHDLFHLGTVRISALDALFAIFFALLWHFLITLLQVYDRGHSILTRIGSVFKAAALMGLLMGIHGYFFHRSYGSFALGFMTASTLFLYQTVRILVSTWIWNRESAKNPLRVLILGSGRRAGKAWRELRIQHHRSVELLGFVDNRDLSQMAPDIASRYFGRVDQLNERLLSTVVDVLVVAMPMQSCYSLMQEAVNIAQGVGVRILYLEDIYASRKLESATGLTLFRELRIQKEHHFVRMAVKRTIDIVVSALGLIILSPLLVLIAIAIFIDDPGPVLFSQPRYGYMRRRFRIYKFRSMVQNAEALMKEVEAANEASGPIFKMRNDPRVTRRGRFLRATSLDELPQLWNVLIGDMSLVGPRPMSVRDVALFDEAVLMRRFCARPGITGLWQVNGRSSVGFDKWIEWDFRYIESWSLRLDMRIIAQTFATVLRRSGAM